MHLDCEKVMRKLETVESTDTFFDRVKNAEIGSRANLDYQILEIDPIL